MKTLCPLNIVPLPFLHIPGLFLLQGVSVSFPAPSLGARRTDRACCRCVQLGFALERVDKATPSSLAEDSSAAADRAMEAGLHPSSAAGHRD